MEATTERPESVFKFFTPETKTLKNGDIEAYVSTEAVDRMGDIIRAKGWELENFKRTGAPVLIGHEYWVTAGGHIPVIGNAVEIEIQRKGLWSVTRFHEKTQISREAALLAREKIMPNWSVGFQPLEAPESRTDENGNFKGFTFTKQELLEYSLVPIPANPEAVSKAMHMAGKGLISRSTAALLAGPSAQPAADSGEERETVEHFLARAAALGFSMRAGQWPKD